MTPCFSAEERGPRSRGETLAELGPRLDPRTHSSGLSPCSSLTPRAPAQGEPRSPSRPHCTPRMDLPRPRTLSPAPPGLPAAGSSWVHPADAGAGARRARQRLPRPGRPLAGPGRSAAGSRVPALSPPWGGVATLGVRSPPPRLPPRPRRVGCGARRLEAGRRVRRPSEAARRGADEGRGRGAPAAADGRRPPGEQATAPQPPWGTSRPSSPKSSWTTTR